jgi:hypothetical protein
MQLRGASCPRGGAEEVDKVNMSLRRSLIMNDKFLMPKFEESPSIPVSAFGVDEDEEVHDVWVLHVL